MPNKDDDPVTWRRKAFPPNEIEPSSFSSSSSSALIDSFAIGVQLVARNKSAITRRSKRDRRRCGLFNWLDVGGRSAPRLHAPRVTRRVFFFGHGDNSG